MKQRDFIWLVYSCIIPIYNPILASIFLFKVNIGNVRTNWEICSKFTIKTPEISLMTCSGVFIVNFEQNLKIVPVFY